MFFIFFKCNPLERRQMSVLMVLIIFSVIFWALFEQSSASMTLFADRALERNVGGFEFTAAQFGSLNALFIIFLAPVFSVIWYQLAKRNLEPSTPVKFSLGIIQAGLGFGALVFGASLADGGKVAAIWLVLAYLLHTMGELCLSPIGLSAVTKLSVQKIVSFMMGTWFLATAYAEYVAAQISKIASIESTDGQTFDVAEAVTTYSDFFESMLYIGVGFGILLLILSPFLSKAMKETDEDSINSTAHTPAENNA